MRIIELLLTQVLPLLPMLMVWFLGIILAIIYWGKYPRASFLLLMACILEIGIHIIMQIGYIYIPPLFRNNGMQGALSMQTVYIIMAFFSALVSALCWVFLFMAIYGHRSAPPASEKQ